MPIRILIADDHSVVRQGLRMFLGLDPDLEVIGEASDGAEAVKMAHELKPDVVLMDMLMPVMDGIAATADNPPRAARHRGDRPHQRARGRLGRRRGQGGRDRLPAKGHGGGRAAPRDQGGGAGQVQLSPQAAARLMREVRTPEPPAVSADGARIDVLRLLAQGKANKEIALDLTIGEKTVKTHVSNILMKLGVQSRTQAALYAAQHGLAELSTG